MLARRLKSKTEIPFDAQKYHLQIFWGYEFKGTNYFWVQNDGCQINQEK